MKTIEIKRIISLLVSFALTAFVFCIIAENVNAADDWKLYMSRTLWIGETPSVNVDNGGAEWATITSVRSSKPSVISIQKKTIGDFTKYTALPKKTGSSKLTVHYTTPKGEKGTITKKIRVKKYPNEIKSLKVNGEIIKTSMEENKFSCEAECKDTKATIEMALKRGWKITDIYASLYDKTGKNKSTTVTEKMLKEGKAIYFPKDYIGLSVSVKMKKGKDAIHYTIELNRDQIN